MRPVRRNSSPIAGDYTDYTDARTELVSRLGSGWSDGIHLASYCSYCERPISTGLAVEHIEPKKGPHGKPHLKGRWENFLLACTNCNSTKGAKKVVFSALYFPDRDNTFCAFDYLQDGNVQSADPGDQVATDTLKLTGLHKERRQTHDEQGRLIAEDRSSQRMEVWKLAEISLDEFNSNPGNTAINNSIVRNAVLAGFFSVWMSVFRNVPEMKNRLIDAFSGTRDSGCFANDASSITPAPNPDILQDGGKV